MNKQFNKSLELNKITIAKLETGEMDKVQGGSIFVGGCDLTAWPHQCQSEETLCNTFCCPEK